MNPEIATYNKAQTPENMRMCDLLCSVIADGLDKSQSKVWHGSPVWFINGNPIVGYGVLKDSVRLLFWSGQSFAHKGLLPEGKFKAAEKRYTSVEQINVEDIRKWLQESVHTQWDYKNIVKRRGTLERI